MSEQANMAARYEREIPEGYEARIEGNKIIFEQKESEDERVRKEIISFIKEFEKDHYRCIDFRSWVAYLERQKKRGPLSKDEEYTLARIIEHLENNDCPSEWKDLLHDVYSLPYQKEQKSAEWSKGDERIRKDIVAAVEMRGDLTQGRKSEIYAYLEKLKEPIPIPDKFSGLKSLMLQYLQSAANCKDDAEIESDTDLWGRKILDYVWKYSDAQKDQKPKILIPKFQEGDTVISTKNNRLTYKILEVGHINELGNPEYKIEIFVDGKPDEPRNIKYIEIESMDSWGEPVEQKPAEWSEKDKKMIDDIIYCLPRMAMGNIEMLPSVAEQYAQHLKSLRDNYKKCNSRWKPSKEQMWGGVGVTLIIGR